MLCLQITKKIFRQSKKEFKIISSFHNLCQFLIDFWWSIIIPAPLFIPPDFRQLHAENKLGIMIGNQHRVKKRVVMELIIWTDVRDEEISRLVGKFESFPTTTFIHHYFWLCLYVMLTKVIYEKLKKSWWFCYHFPCFSIIFTDLSSYTYVHIFFTILHMISWESVRRWCLKLC